MEAYRRDLSYPRNFYRRVPPKKLSEIPPKETTWGQSPDPESQEPEFESYYEYFSFFMQVVT